MGSNEVGNYKLHCSHSTLYITAGEYEKTSHKASTKINLKTLAKEVEQYSESYQDERAARFGVSR